MLAILEARQTLYDAISAAVDGLIPEGAQAFPGRGLKTRVLPRLEVVQVSARAQNQTLKGDVYAERGVVEMFIVAEKGNGEQASMDIAQVMAAAIYAGRRYDIAGGGQVAIVRPTNVKSGYEDDTSWRLPVEIEYLATG